MNHDSDVNRLKVVGTVPVIAGLFEMSRYCSTDARAEYPTGICTYSMLDQVLLMDGNVPERTFDDSEM